YRYIPCHRALPAGEQESGLAKLFQATHALRGNIAPVVVLPALSDRAGGGPTRADSLCTGAGCPLRVGSTNDDQSAGPPVSLVTSATPVWQGPHLPAFDIDGPNSVPRQRAPPRQAAQDVRPTASGATSGPVPRP